MKQIIPFLLILAFSLGSSAFAQSTPDLSATTASAESSSAALSKNFRLNPKDIIRVDVFQEPDLQKDVRVAADGTITLPLIGKVPVGGRTVLDTQQLITDLYNRDFLVDPQINIIVVEYAEKRVQVLGQVNRPGYVLIPPEEKLTFSQAISGAGGLTRLAEKRKIQLTRTRDDGKQSVINLDLVKILRDTNTKDPVLQDGDVIFVQEDIF